MDNLRRIAQAVINKEDAFEQALADRQQELIDQGYTIVQKDYRGEDYIIISMDTREELARGTREEVMTLWDKNLWYDDDLIFDDIVHPEYEEVEGIPKYIFEIVAEAMDEHSETVRDWLSEEQS